MGRTVIIKPRDAKTSDLWYIIKNWDYKRNVQRGLKLEILKTLIERLAKEKQCLT